MFEGGLQVIPQVFEKFNFRQMQEDINKRLDMLRDTSINTSSERLQEATAQVKEILVKLKSMSEELETTLPRSLCLSVIILRKNDRDDFQRKAHGRSEEAKICSFLCSSFP